MANKALFISINDLKRKSIIGGDVDSDKLIQFIEVAQDTHIQNYLGGKLYDKLVATPPKKMKNNGFLKPRS